LGGSVEKGAFRLEKAGASMRNNIKGKNSKRGEEWVHSYFRASARKKREERG